MIATWHLFVYAFAMTARHPTQDAQAAPATDTLVDQLEKIAVGAVGLTTLALAHADAGFELTFPQWRALLVLGESEDGARVGEVAARVGVTLPATSRLIRRLERRGLTTLAIDEQDRRAVRARLTNRGLAVRAAILAYRRTALREVASALPETQNLDLASGLRAIAAELDPYA